ncbi:MAG: hypothetical protein NT158_07660 [Cyanobacteria bacterium]|nr:hypothetical protein [Cyanobacteriota bacterium]
MKQAGNRNAPLANLLFAALGVMASAQGTINNLSYGTPSGPPLSDAG